MCLELSFLILWFALRYQYKKNIYKLFNQTFHQFLSSLLNKRHDKIITSQFKIQNSANKLNIIEDKQASVVLFTAVTGESEQNTNSEGSSFPS